MSGGPLEGRRSSVLVGIVTLNRAAILPKAIDSALAQTRRLDVMVIDDASTDETPGLAARYPDVAWIRRPDNQGYMSARNEMMAIAGYDYFVSLDDDAWFMTEHEAGRALDYLDAHPSVAAVAFDILSPDQPAPQPRREPEPAANFIGCGHVLRLSAVREVGAYEATPGSYGGEEKDLCLRLMDAGYGIVRIPGAHVWHDKTPVARELLSQHRSGVCNDLVMTLRRTPLVALPLALPAKLARHWLFARRHGLLEPCREGMRLFRRSLREVLRSRRPVRLSTLLKYMSLSRGAA